MKTLDDYAIAAMQGLLSNNPTYFGKLEKYAEISYDMAEAMIKESRKRRAESNNMITDDNNES